MGMQEGLVILLVEDDEHDIFFVREATERNGGHHKVHAVRDGSEAIAYLKGQGQYSDRQKFPMPNVILTDLKMPGMSGFDFLHWLKDHVECGVIPAIVYSSSGIERDVLEAYRVGANAYIEKPSSMKEMVNILQFTWEFWSRCKCPPKPTAC